MGAMASWLGASLQIEDIDVHLVVAFGPSSSGWRGAAGFHRDRCLQAGVALKAPDSDRRDPRGGGGRSPGDRSQAARSRAVLSSWVHRVETAEGAGRGRSGLGGRALRTRLGHGASARARDTGRPDGHDFRCQRSG